MARLWTCRVKKREHIAHSDASWPIPRHHHITTVAQTLFSNQRGLPRPERLFGFTGVVGSTPQGDILDGRLTARRVRHAVVILEEATLGTALAARAYEGALAAGARPHAALDLSGNVP